MLVHNARYTQSLLNLFYVGQIYRGRYGDFRQIYAFGSLELFEPNRRPSLGR